MRLMPFSHSAWVNDVNDRVSAGQALAEIDSLHAKGGSDKTKILTATIWLADIGDFAAMIGRADHHHAAQFFFANVGLITT